MAGHCRAGLWQAERPLHRQRAWPWGVEVLPLTPPHSVLSPGRSPLLGGRNEKTRGAAVFQCHQ